MNEYMLWYKQPAGRWLEGLPIGNGTMGAMVMGGISDERLALKSRMPLARKKQAKDNREKITSSARNKEKVL